MSDITLDQIMRRRQRIVALLESYHGEHVKLVQVMTDLRLDPENDIDTATFVHTASRLVNDGKIQSESKDRTIYYWIDPPVRAEPEPDFNLRHVKAVTRERVR